MNKLIDVAKKIIPALLVIPAFFFLYFSFIPQYDIRDHEGYLAGGIILAGFIAFTLLCNLLKRFIYLKSNKRDKLYIVSIADVVAFLISLKSILFYHARVYVLSLGLFFGIIAFYLFVRVLLLRADKTIKINYITAVCIAGIVSVASTVIRGMYLFRWQILATIILLLATIALEMLDKENVDSFFPYDFTGWIKETKSRFVSKYITSLVIVLSYVVMYLILGPLEIYAGNMLSFSFGYATFLPLFVLVGIVALVVVPCLLSLLSSNTFKFVSIILTAFSLLSYIQYLFMNTKLMEEDGARLRLDTMGIYPTVNMVIWIVLSIVIVVVLYMIRDNWDSASKYACGFITAIQLVAVTTLVIKCVNAPAPRYYQLTGEKMFSVAKDENVIVLMPDAFARKYLNELLNDDPSYMDIFKDFTYYDNMDSEYHPTFPSVIHLITGNDGFEGLSSGLSEERVKWQTESWNSDTCKEFFNAIEGEGYDFYMNIPSACELFGAYDDVKEYVKNVEYAESNVDKPRLMKMLFSMSIYRCVPYLVKPPFEYFSWDFAELERYNGKVAAYRNEDFYNEVKEGITVDESISKMVHVMNWHGFHEGYTNDEYCNYVENAEENGITQLQNEKGVMLCINTYFEELKKVGMYDKSTIIVMGDHGRLFDGCVFIKLPDEKHDEVIINDDPKLYSGFQQTILDFIGAGRREILAPSWYAK